MNETTKALDVDNMSLSALAEQSREIAKKQRTILGGSRDGIKIVYVPLSDGDNPEYAIVVEEVWNELLNQGMWTELSKDQLGRPQVYCAKDKRKIPLYWLIADTTSDEEVKCIDGDNKNLINSNLLIRTTHKPTRYRDLLSVEHGRARPVLNYRWENDR